MYILLVVSIAFVILWGVRFNQKKWNMELIVSDINQLRGVMAIFIILSHITLVFREIPLVLLPFSKISTICVGYFFVSSGYGLAWSNTNKVDYLKKVFLKKKLMTLVIMYLVSYCIFLIGNLIYMILGGESYVRFTPLGIYKTINWYLVMQAILYIVFWIIYTYARSSKQASWIISLFLFIWCIGICKVFPNERSYYISEQCFGLGILLFEYRIEIKKMLEKFELLVLVVVVVLCGISMSAFFVQDATIEDVITHNLLCIAIYLALVIFYNYFSINNKIIKWLKKISFEMYIFQFSILEFYKKMFSMYEKPINYIYVFLVIITDILVAYTYARIKQNRLISKK